MYSNLRNWRICVVIWDNSYFVGRRDLPFQCNAVQDFRRCSNHLIHSNLSIPNIHGWSIQTLWLILKLKQINFGGWNTGFWRLQSGINKSLNIMLLFTWFISILSNLRHNIQPTQILLLNLKTLHSNHHHHTSNINHQKY